MPVIKFQCPACGASFEAVADKAGRKGTCKHCGGPITVPSEAPASPAATHRGAATGQASRPVRKAPPVVPEPEAPAPPRPPRRSAGAPPSRPNEAEAEVEEEDEESPGQDSREERRRRRTDTRAGWRKVGLGLLLLIVMACVGLGMTVLGWVEGIATYFASPGLALTVARYSTIPHTIVGLCTGAVTLAGYGLCCFVPRRHGSAKLAVAALVLCGLTVVTSTAGGLIIWMKTEALTAGAEARLSRLTQQTEAKNLDLQKALADVQQSVEESMGFYRFMQFYANLMVLLPAAQYLTFAFFLHGLARSLKSAETAESCMNLIKLSAALLVGQLVFQLFLGLMLGSLLGMGILLKLIGPFGCVMQLLHLVQAVWYVLVLIGVRGLVKQQAGRRGKWQPA